MSEQTKSAFLGDFEERARQTNFSHFETSKSKGKFFAHTAQELSPPIAIKLFDFEVRFRFLISCSGGKNKIVYGT